MSRNMNWTWRVRSTTLVAMGRLHGIHVPMITPFTADDEIALDELAGLVGSVLDAGAAGIVALGTTAEAAALDPDERRAVVDLCAGICRERRATLVVGAGSNDTRTVGAALCGLGEGVAAALVTVPYFTRPTEAGVVAHFTALAAHSPVPLVIYHIPYRTGLALSAECLRALARIPGVAGFKYSPGVIDAATVDLLGDLPPGVDLLAGDDVLLAPLLALGARGGILASALVVTERFVEFERLARNDVSAARPLGHVLARWSAAAFAEPNPTVLKGVLHAVGRISTSAVRLPLLPAARSTVDAALTQLCADRPPRTSPR